MESKLEKFKTYSDQINFCKGIVFTGIKCLLIGSDEFKQDVLGDKKETKLSKGEKYETCLCEEDYVQSVSKYTKKIKNSIIILHNDESQEFVLEYKHPSMSEDYNSNIDYTNSHKDYYVNQNQSKQEINEDYDMKDVNAIQEEFEEIVYSFVSEYVEVIYSRFKGINKEELYKILYEMFVDSYNAGRLASQTELYSLLGNFIAEEKAMGNDNGEGYIN